MSIVGDLERLRYFTGRLLSAEDFEREQRYLLDRARRHNRFLHGWGVASGLQVSLGGPGEVRVEPGMAIDCAGNEIVLSAAIGMRIAAGAPTRYVALAYREVAVQPIPRVGGGTEPSLIREAAELLLLDADPCRDHRGIGPRTPGCGRAHPICLARLKASRGGWTVRRAAGVYLSATSAAR